MCCKKPTAAPLQHQYPYLICYHHLAKLSRLPSTYSDKNNQHLTNLINMVKNIGAAIPETRLLKFKKTFCLKYIKVLNAEAMGGEGATYAHDLSCLCP